MMGENGRELSIIDFLRMILSYKWLILILAMVFSVGFFVKTMFFTDDTYTSSGVLYVSNHVQDVVTSDSVERSDIETSRVMTSTCAELLKTRSYLTHVSDATGNKYDWRTLRGMITISSVNATELLSISVVSEDPDDSYAVAKAVIETAPSQLGAIFSAGTIEIIDEAGYPNNRNSRGTVKNTSVGFIVGLALGVMLAFLLAMFDRRVHKDTDLQRRYDIPMLGSVMNE